MILNNTGLIIQEKDILSSCVEHFFIGDEHHITKISKLEYGGAYEIIKEVNIDTFTILEHSHLITFERYWNTQTLKVGDCFVCNQYFNILRIHGLHNTYLKQSALTNNGYFDLPYEQIYFDIVLLNKLEFNDYVHTNL